MKANETLSRLHSTNMRVLDSIVIQQPESHCGEEGCNLAIFSLTIDGEVFEYYFAAFSEHTTAVPNPILNALSIRTGALTQAVPNVHSRTGFEGLDTFDATAMHLLLYRRNNPSPVGCCRFYADMKHSPFYEYYNTNVEIGVPYLDSIWFANGTDLRPTPLVLGFLQAGFRLTKKNCMIWCTTAKSTIRSVLVATGCKDIPDSKPRADAPPVYQLYSNALSVNKKSVEMSALGVKRDEINV